MGQIILPPGFCWPHTCGVGSIYEADSFDYIYSQLRAQGSDIRSLSQLVQQIVSESNTSNDRINQIQKDLTLLTESYYLFVNAQNDRDNEQNDRILANEKNIILLQQADVTINARIDTLSQNTQQNLDVIYAELDELFATTEDHTNDIISLKGLYDALNTQVTTNTSDIARLNERVTDDEQAHQVIMERLTTDEIDIASLKDRMYYAEIEINYLEDHADQTDTRLTILENDDEETAAKIASWYEDQHRQDEQINQLLLTYISTAQIYTTFPPASTSDTAVPSAKLLTDVYNAMGGMTINQNVIRRLDSMENDVDNLYNITTDHSTRIEALETQVIGLDTGLTFLAENSVRYRDVVDGNGNMIDPVDPLKRQALDYRVFNPLQARVTDIENLLDGNIRPRITDLESRMTEVELVNTQQNTTITNNYTSLNTRVTNIEGSGAKLVVSASAPAGNALTIWVQP